MLPDGLDIVIGWLPFAAGLTAAIVTTQLAAFASARRASNIRPTDALRESAIQPRPVSLLRGLIGLAALAGGAAVLMASGSGRDSSAPAAALVWMLAVALLGPLLAWPFTLADRLPLAAFSRGPGLLARANTRANLRRVASVATPLMLAVSLVCTFYYGKTMLEQQTIEQTADGRQRTTSSALGSPRASAGHRSRGARLPGVAQASGSFATAVIVAADGTDLRMFPARAVDDHAPGRHRSRRGLRLARGSAWSALAVSADRARLFGWQCRRARAACARRRHPGDPARRRDVLTPARIRRHRAAARAGRAPRHGPVRRRRVRRGRPDGPRALAGTRSGSGAPIPTSR